MRIREPKKSRQSPAPENFDECLRKGKEIFAEAPANCTSLLADQRQSFNEEAAQLRWFLLPSEAQEMLRSASKSEFCPVKTPFQPREYEKQVGDRSATKYDPAKYSTMAFKKDPSEPLPKPIELANRDARVLPSGDGQPDENASLISSSSDCSESQDLADSSECDHLAAFDLYDVDTDDSSSSQQLAQLASAPSSALWRAPVRGIMKPTLEAILRYKMISNGDRVLVCVSGGKDSLTLLHSLRQYQRQSCRFGIEFQIGAITVDPGSTAYDPSPLIPYMQLLGIPYYYEQQCKS